VGFSQITSRKNKIRDEKIADLIKDRYRHVLAIINYGSQVLNINHNKSDFDYIVIVKPGKALKTPIKEDLVFNRKKVSANVLTIRDLEEDAKGKHAHYFVSKLINPLRFVTEEGDARSKVLNCLGLYLKNFARVFIPNGNYTPEEFAAKFFKSYISLFPNYSKYFCAKLGKNKAEVWKMLVNHISGEHTSLPHRKGKIILNKSKYNRFFSENMKEKLVLDWYVYGIKLRGKKLDFPEMLIKKNHNWLLRNRKCLGKALVFLDKAS
jgi:hypothetical protein